MIQKNAFGLYFKHYYLDTSRYFLFNESITFILNH